LFVWAAAAMLAAQRADICILCHLHDCHHATQVDFWFLFCIIFSHAFPLPQLIAIMQTECIPAPPQKLIVILAFSVHLSHCFNFFLVLAFLLVCLSYCSNGHSELIFLFCITCMTATMSHSLILVFSMWIF